MSHARHLEEDKQLLDRILHDLAPQNRRHFLVNLAAFGTAAGLSGTAASQASTTAPATAAPAAPPRRVFVKDDSRLLNMGATVRSGQYWNFSTWITPVEEFYIRNHYPTPTAETKPELDKKNWKLKVTGNAIERPFEITYEQLLGMPSRTIIATMECHGNCRTLFWEQQDLVKEVTGGNWTMGAIGNGEWQIVPISRILERAGVKRNAVSALMISNVDGNDMSRPMPVSELLERGEDIGLCFKLNGNDLTPDHGAPVRLVVPGWGGTASIKWLTEIRIDDRNHWVRLNTRGEAYIGPTYQPPAFKPDDFFFHGVTPADIKGPMVTWMPVKSTLTVPLVLEKSPNIPANYPLKRGEWPILKAGRQMMQGYAWAPQFGVAHVDYRIDGGPWQRAQIYGPNLGRYTWVRFQFPWDATVGDHVIETRTTDLRGNTQPETVPLNILGVANNSIPKFKIRVVA
ncbi:MAG: molybdopterin-dependent oxidoreductase [Casimicrobiaceae bacterium]|nr:molybdopterin-dependent oxidoreductase [Casimicrobiaceae bacterium]MCX8098098.1 molybdopterin-dependent oxidoreductase [Casimicrobiaceae bacterium]MDW8311636.1 molybdopterin-dependent oxidoreductase [Burkholderiales bacterium]